MALEYKTGTVPPSGEVGSGAYREEFYSIFTEMPKVVPSTIRKTGEDGRVYFEY